MFRVPSIVRALMLAGCCASVAAGDPAARSSLPWIVAGGGPVARSGRTLFFGNATTVLPRANRAGGMVVFSDTESVGEPITAASALILTAIPDGAGGWYAGGSFPEGASTRRRVVHVLPDGRLDPAFVVDLGSTSGALARSLVLNGARLIVTGTFTTVNQVARTGVAWVDASTGQVLPTTSVLSGELAVQSGSTLFLATASGLFAIDATTGAARSTFTPPVVNGNIQAVAADGQFVYLGGSFTLAGGQARANLARVDGATGFVDPTWNPGASTGATGGQVSGLVVSGGVLYVGGAFSTVGGQPRNSLAAIAASGAVTPWRADTDGSVFGLTVHAGAVYVAGGFERIGGLPRRNTAAVSVATPAAVLPWHPSTDLAVGVAAGGGRVAVFGSIAGWGGLIRRGLAAVDAVTGDLLPWTADFGGGSLRELVVAGTRLIAGGTFTTVNGQTRRRLAMFDLETRALLPMAPSVTGEVRALAVANEVLYMGGLFSDVDGVARTNLAAIDLRSGALLPWRPQANGAVNDIVVMGTDVVVGGDFTALADSPVARQRIGVGEITAAGAITALTVNIDPGGVVNALAADAATLFVGGQFSISGVAGGGTRANAAAVAFATNAVLSWNPAANAEVTHLSLHGGFVYLQGAFDTVGGVPRRGLARVTSTGTGTLSGWQVAGAQLSFSRIGGLAVFDDGVLLSTRGPQGSGASDDGRFLPEESLSGVPGPPAAPSARVVGATLTLTFEPPVSGPRPASHLLEAGSAPGLRNIAAIPLTATTFTVPGVPPGVYYLRVRAVGPAGVGAASRELPLVVGATTCTTAPAAPDVPVVTVSGNTLAVDWQAPPGSAPASYTLQAGSSAGLTNIATLPMGPSTSFAVSGVPAGVYFLRVTAANACGESAVSPEATARVGAAPGPPGTPLQFTGAVAGRQVSLTWLTSTGDAPSGHVLEVGSGPTLRDLGTITLGPGATFAAAGVPPGTYYLRVRASNGSGLSLPSGELVLVVP